MVTDWSCCHRRNDLWLADKRPRRPDMRPDKAGYGLDRAGYG